MGFFFDSTVKELNGYIYVDHVKFETIKKDLDRVFNTTRLSNNLFYSIKKNSFIIHSFFAMELYFALDLICKQKRKSLSNARDIFDILKGLRENTWLANLDKSFQPRLNLEHLSKFNVTPLVFQKDFLDNYSENITKLGLKGMLLAGTAGSGKTLLSLFTAECAEADKIIIISPKPALYRVWDSTIKERYNEKQECWIYDSGKPYKNERFMIFHYEALAGADKYVDILKSCKTFVILDESHNLNEIRALRTQRFLNFCSEIKTDDIILASGTPIKALGIEAITLFRAIDPLFTEEVEEKFKKIFKGEANKVTEMLSNRLDNVSFKISKKELNLDEPVFKEILVKIDDPAPFTLKAIAKEMEVFVRDREKFYSEHKKEYSDYFYKCLSYIENNYVRAKGLGRSESLQRLYAYQEYRDNLKIIISLDRMSLRYHTKEMVICTSYEKNVILPNLPDKETKDKFNDYKSVVKYVDLKIQGECLGRVIGRRRIDVHLAMVPFINFDEILNSTIKKTVVFSSYVEVIELTEKTLKQQGKHPLTVYGKNTNELSSTVKKFEVDGTANPLIATFASLSTAVPLVMADTMLMINTPFRNYIFEQAVSRIHRLGADTQTCVITISLDTGTEPNISSRTVDILKWSQDQVSKIMKTDLPYKIEDDDSISLEAYGDEIISELNIPDISLEHIKQFHELRNFVNSW